MDSFLPDPDIVILWLRTTALQVLIIAVLAIVAYWLLRVSTRHLTSRIQGLDDVDGSDLDKRTDTIMRLIRTTGGAVILITALLMILSELGINITPMLASVGIIGLALGLGAQTLVKDIIGGLFIILEGQYQIGDVIEFNGRIGNVEDMTLRTTQVRDFKGYLHIVPNGEIRLLTNRTRGWSRAIVDVGISYDEDVELAIRALEELGASLINDPEVSTLLLEDPIVTGVEEFDDGQVRLRISVKTLPNEHWGVQRHIRRRIRGEFPEKGVTMAQPRQEVVLLQGQ
jgi:small conductance mechanosensitive channel